LGNPAARHAAGILKKWKAQGILVKDNVPAIYIYYQFFTLPGQADEFCRKGFICNIKVYDWDENVVLRHEETMPKSVNDRVELLAQTQLNVSPTHGLYTDASFELEEYMERSILNPLYETEDYQGVRDVLSVIYDDAIIQRFVETLKDKQIILADGHHRYAAALAYRRQMLGNNPLHTGNEGYNYHLMYLTNTEADDLRILPTHRLIKGLDPFDEAALMAKFENDFEVKPLANAFDIDQIILGKKWTFGILFQENAFRVRLKPEAFSSLKWNFPEEIRKLDLTVMHYFIIEKILGIPGKYQSNSDCVEYNRSFPECLTKVVTGEAQMALITREVSINDVKKVCSTGYTMPQKSTFFYPKVICGFLFGSIRSDEDDK
jgi:uncharacterized protein (DUF1015 family)